MSPVFTTDAPEFGGSGFADTAPVTVEAVPSHGNEQSVALRIPAFRGGVSQGEGSFPHRSRKSGRRTDRQTIRCGKEPFNTLKTGKGAGTS